MPTLLGLPFVLALVFTLGCVLIQKAGRRAEAITEGLGFLFLVCVLLDVIALMAQLTANGPPHVALMRTISGG